MGRLTKDPDKRGVIQNKWTKEESRLLVKLFKENKTKQEMILVLNRSYCSIANKLRRLGLVHEIGTNQREFGKTNPMLERYHSAKTKNIISQKAKERLKDKTNHPSWNGGRRINHNGYISIRMPDHPKAVNGYIFEHVWVMENVLGRYLEDGECVHHINFIKTDNGAENLMLFKNNSDHQKYHAYMRRKEVFQDEQNCFVG